LRGGFGQAVADYLLSEGYRGEFRALGIPDRFITHGTRAELLREVGLDAESLRHSIEEFLIHNAKPEGGLLRKLGLRRNGTWKKKDDTHMPAER
jgi:hypothetical protein